MILQRCAILIFILLAGIRGEAEPSRPRVTVYFPDYRFTEGAKPRLYGTSNLVLFSAEPKADGDVDFSRVTPAMIDMGKAARLENRVKVTFCVGGWGRGDRFAAAVSTPESRERFLTSLVQFCENNELDGVDIDWEFPEGDRQHADFTKFLQDLSARLHAGERILTVALGEKRPLTPEDYAAIDEVNLMSYHPWTPQPHKPWLEKAVQSILGSGLAPEKLNIGLGFYAKEMGGERRAISYAKLAGPNGQKLPDSEFGFSPTGRKACDTRFELVKKYRLGGIMIWDYGHDSPDPGESLLRYVSENPG